MWNIFDSTSFCCSTWGEPALMKMSTINSLVIMTICCLFDIRRRRWRRRFVYVLPYTRCCALYVESLLLTWQQHTTNTQFSDICWYTLRRAIETARNIFTTFFTQPASRQRRPCDWVKNGKHSLLKITFQLVLSGATVRSTSKIN